MSPFDHPERLDALDTLDPADDARGLPADLEDRVVRALASRRLLRPRTRFAHALAWAACVILAFAAGHWLPRADQPVDRSAPATAEGGPHFMLLLYQDDAFEAAPTGREADRVEEYVAWLQGLTGRGIQTTGDELAPQRALLGAPVAAGATDQPPGQVAGYFVIEVATFEAAVEVASTCPHLRHGGRVAVRSIIDHG